MAIKQEPEGRQGRQQAVPPQAPQSQQAPEAPQRAPAQELVPGSEAVPVQPTAPPQWSPDRRWWWTGQQWVPAPIPPKPPGPGALAKWALGFGIFAVTAAWGTFLTLANPPESGFNFGWEMVIMALGVNTSGLVLGILALVRPGHGHGQRPRRAMAWTAIGLSLVSFAGLGLILLAKNL